MMLSEIARIVFALIAVVGMIGLAALVARKAGLASASGGFVRKRRLRVVETLALDARRRIAIIKCDDAEHLIVLGPAGETVIERHLDAPIEAPEEDTPPVNPFAGLQSFAEKFRAAADKDAA